MTPKNKIMTILFDIEDDMPVTPKDLSGAVRQRNSHTLTYVSFPTLARTFRALARLAEAGRPAEYDGSGPFGRYWIRIYRQ